MTVAQRWLIGFGFGYMFKVGKQQGICNHPTARTK
jgi:hypothetical protein